MLRMRYAQINLGQVGSCPVCINVILAVCWDAQGGSERPTVDAIALYLMCLQAQVYPHLSLPPSSDWGEGEGPTNLSGLHSSQHFTSYLS